MHDTQDVIDDELDEDISSWEPSPDPVSAGVGAIGYVTPFTVEDCVERFENSTAARFPETFDRFYFDAPGGRLLVDLLADGTPEQLEHERARKRVAFKTGWCAEHDWRYLPLAESDITPEKIRMLLAGETSEPRVSTPGQRKPAARRGGIQRPKAAAH